MENTAEFETVGYSKDFLQDGKYVGSITISEPDRDNLGYSGRRVETLIKEIRFKNNRVLKAGASVVTELHVLCGNVIGNPFKEIKK